MTSCWAISLGERPRDNKSLTCMYRSCLSACRARRFRSASARGGLLPLIRCRQIRRGRQNLSLAKVFVTARDLLFDGLDEVFHEVKTIRDLDGLRRPFTCSLCVVFAAIPAYIVDFWVIAHPVS